MLEIDHQVSELIDKNKKILICLPKTPSTDAVAAGLAMLLFLEKKGKQPKIVADNFALPHTHSFLPKSQEIFSDITALRKFIISLDLKDSKIDELNYAIVGDKLNIYITPKNGFFNADDISSSDGDFTFDLIITLDCPDLAMLGEIYDNNVELFYKIPVINIDHSPANEQYGQVNMVDVNATSVSEMIFEMMQRTEGDHLDEYIATNLLTGIISKTKSFKTTSVTPRSLSIASHLISSGARREEIVKNLYQNKSIHTLKLWGKALTKLKKDEQNKIVWALLEAKDFVETGATEEELENVIDELIINTPEAKNVFIVYDRPGFGAKALISTAHYIKTDELFSEYYVKGSPDFTYLDFKNMDSQEAERMILDKLKKVIRE